MNHYIIVWPLLDHCAVHFSFLLWLLFTFACYTAILRKVVRKSACDNPERYCGWFKVHCSSKKFERIAREAMDVSSASAKERKKKVGSTAAVSGTVY